MYKSTYGLWEVTTEGDVEGRSTNHLGTHKGHIDEIALHLANQNYYSLTFKLVEAIDEPKEVNVQLDIESGTWDMRDDLIPEMKKFFADRPIHIENCNYFSSFKITTEKNIREEDRKKKNILDKLSDYEKELLAEEIMNLIENHIEIQDDREYYELKEDIEKFLKEKSKE